MRLNFEKNMYRFEKRIILILKNMHRFKKREKKKDVDVCHL